MNTNMLSISRKHRDNDQRIASLQDSWFSDELYPCNPQNKDTK